MEAKTALDRVADALPPGESLAEKLGVSAQVLSNWKARGVPAQYCMRLVALSGGIVTLQQLRPDDWRDYWPPELVAPAPAKRVRKSA
jgi:DNA-binding transcriptional regulator YdaS (Cro superfamily)